MKEELKKILQPYFTQLNEAENDLNRILSAQNNCVISRGHNGCWNCETKEENCSVAQTKLMVDARRKIIHMNIVKRVKEWIDSVE